MPVAGIEKEVFERFDRLKSERGNPESDWREISDDELGRRDFSFGRPIHRKRTARLYDDTARVSGILLAGTMHSLLVPPMKRWADLRYFQPELNDRPAPKRWLWDASNHLFNAFNRPRAGFHGQVGEGFTDLIFFGNFAMFVEDVLGEGARFTVWPLPQVYVSENANGIVDSVYRRYPLTARQAHKQFPGFAHAGQLVSQGNGEDILFFIHALQPNEDFVTGSRAPLRRKILSMILSEDPQQRVSEGGFDRLPVLFSRWRKEAGLPYGTGPGHDALSDSQMLQEMKKTVLIGGQKAVNPPMLMENEAIISGRPRLTPGALLVAGRSARMNPPIQPIAQDLRGFPISRDLIQDTRLQVQDAMLSRLVEMVRDPRMTATQVLEIVSNMQRHLAPIMGRFQNEFLDPLVDRVFDIEFSSGRMPEPPPEVRELPLKVEYLSPIMRAQRADDVKAVVDFATFIANLAQSQPEVMHVLDGVEAGLVTADGLGVPPQVVRTRQQVERLIEADNRKAQEREAERQAGAVADVVQKTGGAGVPAVATAA